MDRIYRAVPLDILYAPHLEEHRFQAVSDLAAATEAKQHFGSEMPFVLWEGERKALTYRPLANLMRSRGGSAPPSAK